MMDSRHGIPSLYSGIRLGALLLWGLLLASASPLHAQTDAAVAPPDTADNFTGTILFIQGRPQADLPVAVGELRATAVSRLEAALRGRGHLTVDRTVMEDLVMKWRVRGSHLVTPGLLGDLRQEHEVGQVLVATLLSDNARFLMTVRLIDTLTGRVTFVDLKDEDLPLAAPEGPPVDPGDWRWVLDGICQDIVPPWAPAPLPDPESLLVLPTRGIASDPAVTSAAAHSLLKTLLGQGLTLIDPSLIEVTMLAAGLPSHWLDARGRRILQDEFGAEVILVSELVSYDKNISLEAIQRFDSELPSTRRRNLTVFSMSMRTVDLATGTALRSAQVIHEKPPATGWFGTPVITTMLQELETTSHDLWAAFSPEAEDD